MIRVCIGAHSENVIIDLVFLLGLALELGHRRRSSEAMLDEVGRLLLNICQAVPQVKLEISNFFELI